MSDDAGGRRKEDKPKHNQSIAKSDQDVPSPESRTERTIAELKQLLESTEAAEELASSWQHDKAGLAAPKRLVRRTARLGDLYAALDTGKSTARHDGQRGVPMWIAVRACKAAWHRDGSWPIIGSDDVRDDQQLGAMRSRHPNHLILRHSRDAPARTPPGDEPPIRQEPTCEDIAQAYRKRGIRVEELIRHADDDW